jgi:hypothetical protein
VANRDGVIQFRVSAGERRFIESEAKSAGISVSRLIRDSLIPEGALTEPPVQKDPAVDLAGRRDARARELMARGVSEHLARVQAAREVTE